MGPVCTIMVGRLDDWLKVVANKRRNITVDPGIPRMVRRCGVQKGMIRSFATGAIACACCRLRSAITCTGAN